MNVRNSPFFFLHLVTVCFLSIPRRLQQETIPQKHVVFRPVHSDNVTAAEQLRRIRSFEWNCWCLFHHRLLWEPFIAAHLKCQINSCCLFSHRSYFYRLFCAGTVSLGNCTERLPVSCWASWAGSGPDVMMRSRSRSENFCKRRGRQERIMCSTVSRLLERLGIIGLLWLCLRSQCTHMWRTEKQEKIKRQRITEVLVHFLWQLFLLSHLLWFVWNFWKSSPFQQQLPR